MRRLTLLLVSLVLLSIQSVLAQSFSVKGTVVSAEDNEPMIGVTIMQEGTSNGVVTDIDGNYTIEIKGASKATLVYSYVGCVTQKHVVKAQTNTLNITLASDSKMMDEVVVVAYGVRKKGTIAGSVSAVKSEKIENVPAASFDQALQGQSTGLQVISSSGEPSKAATFQIRGTNSINSGKSPLFILDGVPISSSDFNTLSPNDIESISVLKDASSTSIYGARAANGVVVITSKRGLSMDKAKITLRAQYGFSELAQTNWKMMNTDERIQFEKEVGLDTGKDYNLLSRVNVNWLDEVFNDRAPLQSYELSINRATDRLNYYVSGGFYDQDGIAQSSTFRRYNIRTNADVKASKWLKVGTNTMAAYEEAQQADDGSYTTVTPISACRFMLPYWNPYAKDGSLASLSAGNWAGTSENPIVYMGLNPIKNKKYKVLSTMYAEIYPIENLTIRTQFGVDFTHSTAFLQSFPSLSSNHGQGTAARQSSDAINLTETTTANYRFTLNDIHSFNVMLGQEAVNFHSDGFQVYSKGQTSDLLTNVSSGTRASRWADSSSDYSYLSFFMRGEYNYKELYYADFSLRTDASSRFGKDHRWGTFWSVGGAWLINKESWFDASWVQELKLKASIGSQGNDNIGDFLYTDRFNIINSNNSLGTSFKSKGTKDITWETNTNFNIGAEFQLWNRVTGSIEYYRRKTSDMLFSFTVAPSLGYASYMDNVGNMVNSGVEMDFNVNIFDTRNFTWDVNVNISTLKNRITMLDPDKLITTEYTADGKGYKGYSNGSFFIGEDLSMFTWRLKEYAGVNEKGESLFYKNVKDEAGNITGRETTTNHAQADYYITEESSIPKVYGGFGTKLKVYGVDFGINFTYQIGGKQYDGTYAYFMSSPYGTAGYNYHKDLLNSWTPENTNTNIPRFQMNDQYSGAMSTRFLTNASFLNIQNINVGYTLPSKWTRKLAINSLRVYMSAENVFYWSKRKGFDPRQSYDETTNATFYSPMRTISGGVSFEF